MTDDIHPTPFLKPSLFSRCKPSPEIRYLNKDGLAVLQQAWKIENENGISFEWRDVPCVEA